MFFFSPPPAVKAGPPLQEGRFAMKCMEARRMVAPFVKKELSEKDTEAFLAHVETCDDCMDELEIYYMAYHTVALLDSSTRHEYDFKKMLNEEIRAEKHASSQRKAAAAGRRILVACAELLLVLSMVTGVRLKQGRTQESLFQRAIQRMQTPDGAADESESETDAEDLP